MLAMPVMTPVPRPLLIRGARVLDLDGDIDNPPSLDILCERGAISAVGSGLSAPAGAEVIDASGMLAIPGLVNSHYHSHDVLAKGLFEDLSLEHWGVLAGPLGSKRSLEEVRARTLAGALECLHNGITTVQDMNSAAPFSDEVLDTIIGAYADAGIRVILGMTVRDQSQLDTIPWIADLAPAELHGIIGTGRDAAGPQMAFVEAALDRIGDRGGLVRWALAPSAPQRCSPALLEAVADLSRRRSLPVYTHVYESRTQRIFAHERLKAHGGSAIRLLEDTGLLGPHVSLAHGIWLEDDELDKVGSSGTNVVLNMLSNLKLKSGVAPILEYRARGVNIALGCDNCSCSDVQSMLQVMKLFCLLAAVSTPERSTVTAAEALRAGPRGGARSAGLHGSIGAIRPAHRADLVLMDLTDPAYVPYNSAIRQLVYADSGRSIRRVIVDGEVVVRDGRSTRVDEAALRAEIEGLMPSVRADIGRLQAGYDKVLPYIDEVNRRAWSMPLSIHRHVGLQQR
jgi:5-methylthioadenosine/S-adenosylhomocysteine deaminase